MKGGGHEEEIASSKKKTNSRQECKILITIYYQNGGKMAKIDTLFMTKTAGKKHTCAYPYSPYKGVHPRAKCWSCRYAFTIRMTPERISLTKNSFWTKVGWVKVYGRSREREQKLRSPVWLEATDRVKSVCNIAEFIFSMEGVGTGSKRCKKWEVQSPPSYPHPTPSSFNSYKFFV